MTRAFSIILLSMLAACQTIEAPLSQTAPVCKVLIGPIRYNSTVKTSRRYAGPDLAPDLNRRNQVGLNLKCAQFIR